MNSLLSSSSNANIGGTFPDGSTDNKDGDEVPPENVELRTLNGVVKLSPDILWRPNKVLSMIGLSRFLWNRIECSSIIAKYGI